MAFDIILFSVSEFRQKNQIGGLLFSVSFSFYLFSFLSIPANLCNNYIVHVYFLHTFRLNICMYMYFFLIKKII